MHRPILPLPLSFRIFHCLLFTLHSLGPSLLLFSTLPLPHVSKCSPSEKKTRTLFFFFTPPPRHPLPLVSPSFYFFSIPFVQLSFLPWDGMDARWKYHPTLLTIPPYSTPYLSIASLYLFFCSRHGMIGIILDPIEPIWV